MAFNYVNLLWISKVFKMNDGFLMLILNDKPGQLCNRLWAFSFFIAFALKHSLKIYIPYFREYQKYFENLFTLPDVAFNILSKPRVLDAVTFHAYRILTNVLRIISRVMDLKALNIYIDHKHWNQEQWQLSLVQRKNKIFFLGSWLHKKDVSALLEYKQQIVMLFEPAKRYRERVDQLFADIRMRYDIIVGIHIRQTDYHKFHGGAYYFDDVVFRRYMNVLQNMFPQKHVCFYLSSDTQIIKSSYYEYEIVYLQHPAIIEDLYALGQCQYIFGPPSTFSMWASFMGDVPLRILKYRNEEITLEQFSPILYQNYFKNGEWFRHIDAPEHLSRHEESLVGCNGEKL